jgi:hypothetical protein
MDATVRRIRGVLISYYQPATQFNPPDGGRLGLQGGGWIAAQPRGVSFIGVLRSGTIPLPAPIQFKPKPWKREELEGFHVCLQLSQLPSIIVLKLNPDIGIPVETTHPILNRDGNIEKIPRPAIINEPRFRDAAPLRRYDLDWNVQGAPIGLRRRGRSKRWFIVLDLARNLVKFGGTSAVREERRH